MLPILNDFFDSLSEKTHYHVGYPYNLKYDYQELLTFLQFSVNNLGDPFINSNYRVNSREFEKEVIAFFATLYQCSDAWGYVTACGTEGNLYGLLLGREIYPDGILYYTQDAHYSIAKAARYYRLDTRLIHSQPDGEMDYSDFKEQLDPSHSAIINLTIGTTFTGAIDDVDKILECLKAKQISSFYIHCDGALAGLFIPYLKPDWFTFHKSIHSLAISGHKFIGSPFPCGIVLARREQAEYLSHEIEYIGSHDTTMMGSRNGHAALFLWYAIQQRQNVFSEEIGTCLDNARYLQQRLQEAGFEGILLNNYSTTVVFPKPSQPLIEKWQLATKGQLAHFIVMQNHERELIDQFVAEMSPA
jgi:histidine decarboxylase